MAIMDRVRNVWNAFRNTDNFVSEPYTASTSHGARPPAQTRLRYTNERSTIASIYTRIGIDVAAMEFRHVKLDSANRYADDINSPLNDCLTFEPNQDQGPRALRQDIAMTLFDEGVAAIVPVDFTYDSESGQMVDIYNLRVGKILQWQASHIQVNVFNEKKNIKEDIWVEKRRTAIIQNPLYSVMNEHNSTLQRLMRKLNLLDVTDDRIGSGKLDLIIQLPYVIKTEARKQQAEQRREAIEMQLKGSQFGIAYADGTEKITQLNRPVENNLLDQVKMLTEQLYVELGLTNEVMNGTADEATMNNYYYRTVEPIVDAVTEGLQRAFLGLEGKAKKERIRHYKNPFKYSTIDKIAESADKLCRNEIVSSNEVRGFLGLPPSKDPKADQLVNSNMPQPPAPKVPTEPDQGSEEQRPPG